MDNKYLFQAYELYRADVANTTTTPMSFEEFKAKFCASKKINWLPYFLGGAALVYLLKK